jgi:hypothetical protein
MEARKVKGCHRTPQFYAAVTAAKVNDITAAQDMPIEAGATYVFDLGYYDYGWWAKMDAAGCRIVTRFKANTPLAGIAELAVPEGSTIFSDRIAICRRVRPTVARTPSATPFARSASGSRRGVAHPVERPRRQCPGDRRSLQAALGDRVVPRWVKQTLKITRFLGCKENAVRIQIAVALIASCCCAWPKLPGKRSAACSPWLA